MDFFSNFVKNTATKVETLTKSATAAANSAVNSLSPTGANSPDEGSKSPTEGVAPVEATGENGAVVNELGADGSSKLPRSGSGDTEGADDEAAIAEGDDDAKGAAFNASEVSQKAVEGAKYFGNFLYSVGNKAAATMSATAKQIKSTVESVGIMQEFTKEQQEFIKEHGGNTELSEPPWVGCEDEEKVKAEILGLSADKRNFVRSPPGGVEFAFDMTASFPVALALLREDPELPKMRYEIVPKLVNEETFWRNYFYRVSLIKQDPNFTTASTGEGSAARGKSFSRASSSSSEGPDDPNETGTELGSEFVSDTFHQSTVSAEEVRKDMYKLGITSKQNADADLDEELAKDLHEFEVVSGTDSGAKVDEDEINRELANFDMK